MRWVVRFRGSSRGVSTLDCLRKLDPNEELGIRNEGGGFAEIDDKVAAVLAFVISSARFLAAQDDETGRCPKVVCKSLMISNPCGLIYVGPPPPRSARLPLPEEGVRGCASAI